jgi:hypothetical protein
VPWFAPEIYYFANRAFAGGMSVVFGAHWSSEADQRRIVAKLEQQSVPVILFDATSQVEFAEVYPIVAAFIERVYSESGPLNGAEGTYRVLVKNGSNPIGYWNSSGVPCFGGR